MGGGGLLRTLPVAKSGTTSVERALSSDWHSRGVEDGWDAGDCESCVVVPEPLRVVWRSHGSLCSWLWLCQGGETCGLRHQTTWFQIQALLPTSVCSVVKEVSY